MFTGTGEPTFFFFFESSMFISHDFFLSGGPTGSDRPEPVESPETQNTTIESEISAENIFR